MDCPDRYERSDVKTEDLDKQTRTTLDNLTKHKLPHALAKPIPPHNSRTSQFYGIPKDHKPGLPLRPVVSSFGSSTENVSLLLEGILNQLHEVCSGTAQSSTGECVDVLRELGDLHEDCIIASLE